MRSCRHTHSLFLSLSPFSHRQVHIQTYLIDPRHFRAGVARGGEEGGEERVQELLAVLEAVDAAMVLGGLRGEGGCEVCVYGVDGVRCAREVLVHGFMAHYMC